MSMKDGKGWKNSKAVWVVHKRLVACIKRAMADRKAQKETR